MEQSKEKRTGKAGRSIGWLVSVLMIFAFAWGFVSLYPTMTREAQKVYQKYRAEKLEEKLQDYLAEVYPLIDGMYVDWYRKLEDDNRTAGEIILDAYQKEQETEEYFVSWYGARKETLSDWYANAYPKELENSGVRYFVYSGNINNGCGTLDPLLVYEMPETYPFFVQIEFNENGYPIIKQERGISNAGKSIDREYKHQIRSNQFAYSFYGNEAVGQSGFTGITVLLACNEKTFIALGQDLPVSYSNIWDAVREMSADYTIFVVAAFAIILIIGLILPSIRPLGLTEGWKAHIPLEFLVAVVFGAVLLIIDFLLDWYYKGYYGRGQGNAHYFGGTRCDMVCSFLCGVSVRDQCTAVICQRPAPVL